MKYSELCKSGATKTEIEQHLSGGGQTAITIRLPKNLRDGAKEYAELQGMSFSALIRSELIKELSARR